MIGASPSLARRASVLLPPHSAAKLRDALLDELADLFSFFDQRVEGLRRREAAVAQGAQPTQTFLGAGPRSLAADDVAAEHVVFVAHAVPSGQLGRDRQRAAEGLAKILVVIVF